MKSVQVAISPTISINTATVKGDDCPLGKNTPLACGIPAQALWHFYSFFKAMCSQSVVDGIFYSL